MKCGVKNVCEITAGLKQFSFIFKKIKYTLSKLQKCEVFLNKMIKTETREKSFNFSMLRTIKKKMDFCF